MVIYIVEHIYTQSLAKICSFPFFRSQETRREREPSITTSRPRPPLFSIGLCGNRLKISLFYNANALTVMNHSCNTYSINGNFFIAVMLLPACVMMNYYTLQCSFREKKA